MLEHDERNNVNAKIHNEFFMNWFLILNMFATPINYLKNPDQEGSLTSPLLAGSLNLAPLKVTPASKPKPFSVTA
jgi:hypothetical protein|tara:strand:+ start:308 stop:532 length:225 start_codon:yes stop_codon:yes gene_type:complete